MSEVLNRLPSKTRTYFQRLARLLSSFYPRVAMCPCPSWRLDKFQVDKVSIRLRDRFHQVVPVLFVFCDDGKKILRLDIRSYAQDIYQVRRKMLLSSIDNKWTPLLLPRKTRKPFQIGFDFLFGDYIKLRKNCQS